MAATVKQGYLLTCIVPLARAHGGRNLAEWLRDQALELGVDGLTVTVAEGGFGRHQEFHAVHDFENGTQPVLMSMAVTPEQADALLARVETAGHSIFFIRTPAEYGITCKDCDNWDKVDSVYRV